MKTYTVEEANRTLPLVSSIVRDIVRQFVPWRERVQEYEIIKASESLDHRDPRAEVLEREVESLAHEIDGYLRELAELGIECKDPGLGLVDFPGVIGGRRVYLCWRLGEPAVAYWHDVDAGYAGRQPLAPHALT
ncbi:MAG TPA: DUF2203 domain-containing protein [Gemmatimonadaceae bacterium]|nr:DUF2203 domain-containing protein [Gemmatimonadaceae bacterium]